MRSSIACLVVLALAGCRGGCGRSEVAADDAAPDAPADTRLVVHDCAGLGPAAPTCAASSAPWDALIEASERLTEIPARHTPPPAEFWTPLDEALGRAASARLDEMQPKERIAAQNAALFLALSAKGHADDLSGRARAYVRSLAFPAASRPTATDPDLGLEAWLGPKSAWIERGRHTTPLMHESVHAFTRVFRLVRTPALRANFSQLVALDDRGEPYLTSVVGSIEVRRGTARDAAACVILPSAARQRCGIGAGLAAVTDVSALPDSHFLGHGSNGLVRCNTCHDAAPTATDLLIGTFDLDAGAEADDLATRRALVLDRLRQDLAR